VRFDGVNNRYFWGCKGRGFSRSFLKKFLHIISFGLNPKLDATYSSGLSFGGFGF